MPPGHRDPADASEWLRRARSNLARVAAGPASPEVVYEDLCFDALQAAEKAIKAVPVHRCMGFPRTHDIASLLTLVARTGEVVPDEVRAADALTAYAVETRYPGLAEDVIREEYLEARRLAQRVLGWAEAVVAAARR
jgi:HEPN domain-containing protein